MKKIIFTLTVFFCLIGRVKANTSNLFEINEAQIDAEFQELDRVETFLSNNEQITFSEMERTGAINQFDLNWTAYDKSASPMFGFSDISWRSFAWGFCCFPVGIFTVILNDSKSNDDRISYFIGIGTILIIGGPSSLFWWRNR